VPRAFEMLSFELVSGGPWCINALWRVCFLCMCLACHHLYGNQLAQSACPATCCATGHDMWHVQLALDMGMSSTELDIAK
jgi:hypothetical protein